MSKQLARILALLILAGLLLSACRQQNPHPSATPVQAVSSPEASPKTPDDPGLLPETPLPSQVFLPTPLEGQPAETPQAAQNSRYTLNAILDYGRHHLSVEEQIDYANRAGEPLADLILMVEPARYPGVFKLNSLNWGDGRPVSDYAWDGGQIKFPLPQPLQPGERVGLSIAFELNLPSPTPSSLVRPIPFGYTERQTNLVDWYPFIPPYVSGKGWLAYPAGYFGEHLAYEIADFQVNIQLVGDGSYGGQPLIIAASAPAFQEGDWYRYTWENARNFAWSVSHQYVVTSRKVGSITVQGYAFPIHAAAGERVLQTTAEALQLFNELFGPYPRQTLAVVEADFLDGMEYDGLYFLSNGFYNLYQGTAGEYLVAIAAHETAHQWWYGLVGNDQAMEPWLDEALCTYSERLFYERIYPEALDWWWAYRLNYYGPEGWVNGSIYSFGGEASPYRAYLNAVYLNGAKFFEDLRNLMGDEAFLAALQDYRTQYAGRLATSQDFFNVLSEHTRSDLTPVINQYFNPAPEFPDAQQ